MSLDKLFYPRAVAVVGSVTPGKLGYELLRQLAAGGYRAAYAVNPKAQGLGDAPGYPSVAAIGRPVDLAVIASPAPTVVSVLEDCGRAGVAAAVVITAGFSEAGNAAGEAEIKRVAAQHGIRVVGPNCAGMLCAAANLYPTLETIPPRGSVSLISQSGALAGQVLAWAKEQGLGFAKFVSFGNRADVDEAELLRYLACDPETQAVAVYVESVAGGRDFMDALAGCARRKPVVVIKAGRTGSGQRATLSHTGSLAGADAVYDAALRQCGAVRVAGVEEMFDVCKGFVYLPPVRGRRVLIVTNSGGPAVLAADAAEAAGLEVAEPPAGLAAELGSRLPAHCALRNPIDLTVEGTESGYRETLRAALAEYDAALAINVAPPYLDSRPIARGVLEAAKAAGKPLAASFMGGGTIPESIACLAEAGVPNFPTGERAVLALRRLAQYYEWLAQARLLGTDTPGTPASLDPPAPTGRAIGAHPRPNLLEPEAMEWLAANGIATPPFRRAATSDEAIAASRALGYPVVMKVVSPDILHKSDRGGVIVNIAGDAAAAAAFERMRAAAAGCDFRGVVVYPLVRDAQEALVGLARDPQFGPVVVCGLGGIYTEILADVALRVAPVGRAEAEAMIGELRGARLLRGARGHAPCDLAALADLIARVSELPFRCPEVAEVDLNPVFLRPDGLVLGDARVIMRSQHETG